MSLTTYTPTKVEIPCSGDIIPAINRITAVHLSHGEYGGRIFSFRPYQWGEPFAVPVEWNVTMRVGDSYVRIMLSEFFCHRNINWEVYRFTI